MRAHPRPRASITVVLFTALLLATCCGKANAALEIRHSGGSKYDAQLTRAYSQCLAPNDASSDGVPACSPPATSVCDFTTGDVELKLLKNVPGIDVDLNLRNVSGPGNCKTGQYSAVFSLRVTADDATCTGGQCTWIDEDIGVVLDPHPVGSVANFQLDHISLEDYLQTNYLVTAGHVANYEVLGVTIIAPDSLPIAAAGAGSHGASNTNSDVTVRYAPPCTSPDTTNVSGVPACSGPTWNAHCDFDVGMLEVKQSVSETVPAVEAKFFDVNGASPLCANGTHEVVMVLRATGPVCSGAPCTLVDVPVVVPVQAVDGTINALVTTGPAFDLSGPFDTVEMRESFLRDPLGEEIASAGVSNAFVLDSPSIRIAFHDQVNPTDDQLTVRAKFPHPPIDPTVGGATFALTNQNGSIYTVTIPAGSWQTKQPRKWQYKDDAGTLGGVRRASIHEYGSGIGFKVELKVKNATLTAASLPSVNFDVSISNATSGTSIGERNAVCKVKPSGVRCRND